MRWLVEKIMRLAGWRFVGERPPGKFIAIGAPHTTNWDFLLFLAAISYFRLRPKVIGKHTLVKGPFGGLMRRWGVIPADRDAPGGLTGQMVAEFNATEDMTLVIAPEGTRARADYWRSGFHRIAVAAAVPVVPAYIDFDQKVVGLGEPIRMSGDVVADMGAIRSFFAETAVGKYPEKVGPIRLREEDAPGPIDR